MKKLLLCIFSLFFLTGLVFSGDIASLTNLGFSSDGRYFMFGQYGYIPEKGKAYGELYIVDVIKNNFVSGGVQKGDFNITLEPGQSSAGALYTLMEKSSATRRKYGIDYLKSGRLLYIKVDDAATKKDPLEEENEDEMSTEETDMVSDPNVLDFRDFVSGSRFKMELNQNAEGEGAYTASSFYINLEVVGYNGLTQTYTIGHPNYKRKKISEYSINRVLVGPDNKSLIIVVAKKDIENNIRYMVETVKLK